MSAYQAKAIYGAASIPSRRLEARRVRTSSTPRRLDRRPETSGTRGWGKREADGQGQALGGANDKNERASTVTDKASAEPKARPTTPNTRKAPEATTEQRSEKREEARPPRPSTPCMNRGDGARRKRISSAGRPQGRPPSSVGMRMFQLESRLLGEHRAPQEGQGGQGGVEAPRQVRPASSGSRAHGAGKISAKLIEEAMEMCRQSHAQSSSAATVCSATEHAFEVPPAVPPPPDQLERPNAPTPEQTNHWLQGMENLGVATSATMPTMPTAAFSQERMGAQCISPRDENSQWLRPRSPTPTKMLAWGEDTPNAGCPSRALCFSHSDDDDPFGSGDHTDGLIHRLIEACQMDDVRRAFGIYERLRRLRRPLYEGVYKLIIECCTRTHQLGHGIQFYETLKSSGQRVSSRIIIVLIEACAREQHSEKVHALWQDWCQPHEDLRPCHREVLMVTLAALVRTLSPDLALELLRDAKERFGDSTWVLNVEAEVQELLQLVALAASEAQQNGSQLGGSLAAYHDLQALLLQLLDEADAGWSLPAGASPCYPVEAHGRKGGSGETLILMEDVDLDLELAAM